MPVIARRAAVVVAILLSSTLTVAAEPLEPLEVYTDTWEPYVRPHSEDLGQASRIVQVALRNMGREPEWRYVDYFISYRLVREGEVQASFPWFKTSPRPQEVLFSKDYLLEVENVLFYSRKRNPKFEREPPELSGQRFGKVIGFSYGSLNGVLDRASKVLEFDSEVRGFLALADGTIDLLPTGRRVGESLLLRYFPHRYHEFRHLESPTATDRVYLIAPRTPEGSEFMRRFDASLRELRQRGVIQSIETASRQLARPAGTGYVRLYPAEGFPVITGEIRSDKGSTYVIVPQGTRALVREWSPSVLQETNREDQVSAYRALQDRSLLEIVDGPHADEQMYVRNIHIEIE